MTPDLQRALTEIDRMIEEANCRIDTSGDASGERLVVGIQLDALRSARSRLSALATTTHGEQG